MARPLDISDIQPVRVVLPSPLPRAFPAPISLLTVRCWEQQPSSLSPGLCLHLQSPAAPPAHAGSVGLRCLCKRKGDIFCAICLHVKDVSAAGIGTPEATAGQKEATWPCTQPTHSSTLLH